MSMGTYDSTNVFDLYGVYILDILGKMFPSVLFSLYRDDALTISRRANGYTIDRHKKDLTSALSSMRFKITIETNCTTVDFVDITLDVCCDKYRPYLKTNKRLSYVTHRLLSPHYSSQESNERCKILKLSSSQDIFNAADPLLQ